MSIRRVRRWRLVACFSLVSALLVLVGARCASGSSDSRLSTASGDCRALKFERAGVDTLRSLKGHPLVDPIAIGRVDGVIAVADRADKAFQLFTSSGIGTAIVGAPTDSVAPFFTLESAFIGSRGAIGVDHGEGIVRTFDAGGVAVRVESLPQDPREQARSIRLVDDELHLRTRFVIGNESGDLVELAHPSDGWVRTMHRRPKYLRSLPTLLRAMMPIHADGASGSIFVVETGDDSVFVLDYRGRIIGRGRLTDHRGTEVARWTDLLAANGGSALTDDSLFVGRDQWASANVIALGPTRAVVQLRRPIPLGLRRHDLNERSLLVAVEVDTTTGVVRSSGWLEIDGTLLGRSPWQTDGAAVARTTDDSFELVEVLTLQLRDDGVVECR